MIDDFPDRIWLVVDDPSEFHDGAVCWSRERVNDSDIEYVRVHSDQAVSGPAEVVR